MWHYCSGLWLRHNAVRFNVSISMNDTTSDNAGVITIPPIIYLVGLSLALLTHYFYPIGFLADSVSVWLGLLFLLVSIPIALFAMLALKRAKTPVDVRKPTSAIVSGGIYRLSRNPMYVSLAFVYLGIACWVNSLWILLLIVPVLVVVDRGIIKREEQYLEQKFGDEYLRYKSKVRRWI